jgi:hypothetical protein
MKRQVHHSTPNHGALEVHLKRVNDVPESGDTATADLDGKPPRSSILRQEAALGALARESEGGTR